MKQTIRPSVFLKLLTTAFFMLLLMNGCKPAMKRKNSEKVMPVVVSSAYKGSIEHKIRLNGEIKGQNQADIYPDVPGKMQKLLVREGERVFRNQIVATVDRSQVGMLYMPASVRSPISGVIGKIYVDRGQTVSIQTPIMMVADTRFVEGVLHIPEKYVPLFRIGQKAAIQTESYPGKVFSGQVYKVASLIDPSTRTLQVRLRLLNMRGRLIPGNYADFTISVRRYPDQVLAPFDAIIDTLEYSEVFVVDEKTVTEKIPPPSQKSGKKTTPDTKTLKLSEKGQKKREKPATHSSKTRARTIYIASKRRVVVGIREGNVVQILSGLKPGDRVVTMGKENIIEGTQLKIKKMAADKKADGTGEAR